MALFDPLKLASRISSTWDSEPRLKSQIRPDPGQLREILEIAFVASLHSEEARPTRFSLILMTEADAEEDDFLRAGIGEGHPLSVSLIRQLAPATESSRTLIAVEEGDSGPLVWGILTPGSSWARFQRGEQSSGTRLPMHLVVTASGPGTLEVKISDSTIWSTHRGMAAKPSSNVLKAGPIHDFFDPAIDALLDELFPGVNHDSEMSEKFFRVGYGGDYRRLIVRLLMDTEEFGHGGTVLFIKSAEHIKVQEALTLKFRTPGLELRGAVMGCMKATFDAIESWKALRRNELITKEALLSWRKDDVALRSSEQELLDKAEFVARLTQVDGAVVITDELDVIGFGAMVKDLSQCPEVFDECRDASGFATESVNSETYGSRHRSAMSFCYDLEAVAFVLSEDGGVRAIKRVGDKLCVWPSIDLDPSSWFVTTEDLIPGLRSGPESADV